MPGAYPQPRRVRPPSPLRRSRSGVAQQPATTGEFPMRKPKSDTHQQRKSSAKPSAIDSARSNHKPDATDGASSVPCVTVAQPPDDDLLLERLRRHLRFLGLTHALCSLDDLLDWATQN